MAWLACVLQLEGLDLVLQGIRPCEAPAFCRGAEATGLVQRFAVTEAKDLIYSLCITLSVVRLADRRAEGKA